jgi:dethiobiotin synthase
VTDAVFSMDGDVAPLGALLALCERHDALLVVDDAHGIGVWGPEGRGSVHALGLRSDCIVYMGTLGKAAGLSGAFVAADPLIIDAWSSVVVLSSPHPTLPALATRPDGPGADRPTRRAGTRRHHNAFANCLPGRPFRLLASATPIQPLVIGDNSTVVRLPMRCSGGLWACDPPPTVPVGSARLRITLGAHTDEDIGRLGTALSHIVSTAGATQHDCWSAHIRHSGIRYLLHALAREARGGIRMKPVAAGITAQGTWDDLEQIRRSSPVTAAVEYTAPYRLRAPASPHFAAEEDGVTIRQEVVLAALDRLEQLAEVVVIEGVGGFRVPLSGQLDSADLAKAIAARS